MTPSLKEKIQQAAEALYPYEDWCGNLNVEWLDESGGDGDNKLNQ